MKAEVVAMFTFLFLAAIGAGLTDGFALMALTTNDQSLALVVGGLLGTTVACFGIFLIAKADYSR
jgi:hypothetical protein